MRTYFVVFRVALDGEPDTVHAVFRPDPGEAYSKTPLTVWTPREGYNEAGWDWYQERTRPALFGEFEETLERLKKTMLPHESVEVRKKMR